MSKIILNILLLITIVFIFSCNFEEQAKEKVFKLYNSKKKFIVEHTNYFLDDSINLYLYRSKNRIESLVEYQFELGLNDTIYKYTFRIPKTFKNEKKFISHIQKNNNIMDYLITTNDKKSNKIKSPDYFIYCCNFIYKTDMSSINVIGLNPSRNIMYLLEPDIYLLYLTSTFKKEFNDDILIQIENRYYFYYSPHSQGLGVPPSFWTNY